MKCLVFLALVLPAVVTANIDLSTYPLTADLRPGSYRLHWSFDVEEQSIRFAVNVSTTGWVGLGLSPTGGMPNSDIVIGWVNDQGQAFLNVSINGFKFGYLCLVNSLGPASYKHAIFL